MSTIGIICGLFSSLNQVSTKLLLLVFQCHSDPSLSLKLVETLGTGKRNIQGCLSKKREKILA